MAKSSDRKRVESIADGVKDPEPKEPQVREPEPGFACPQCRYPMRVYRTRPLTGSVYRERICDRCRYKLPTEETPSEALGV